jgi:hypothetical protein
VTSRAHQESPEDPQLVGRLCVEPLSSHSRASGRAGMPMTVV